MSALDNFLCENFGLSAGEITDDLAINNVEAWNSLKHIELILGLEEMFSMEFTPDDVVEMTSVGGIRAVLARYGLQAD